MDVNSAINNVVKSIKEKETAVADSINDIQTFSKELTMFNDLVIPTINGESPISFDSLASQNSNIDPEYLDKLKSIILQGIKVPKSLLNEYENSYHTTLSQENVMFAFQIISLQKMYEPQIEEFINKLYSIYSGKSEVEDHFKVSLNRPITLLNESISNMINNVNGIVDFIVNLYKSDEQTGEAVPQLDKVAIAKEFIPSLPWEKFDKLFEEAKEEIKKKEIGSNDNNGVDLNTPGV
jgi:hypothetical protein